MRDLDLQNCNNCAYQDEPNTHPSCRKCLTGPNAIDGWTPMFPGLSLKAHDIINHITASKWMLGNSSV